MWNLTQSTWLSKLLISTELGLIASQVAESVKWKILNPPIRLKIRLSWVIERHLSPVQSSASARVTAKAAVRYKFRTRKWGLLYAAYSIKFGSINFVGSMAWCHHGCPNCCSKFVCEVWYLVNIHFTHFRMYFRRRLINRLNIDLDIDLNTDLIWDRKRPALCPNALCPNALCPNALCPNANA